MPETLVEAPQAGVQNAPKSSSPASVNTAEANIEALTRAVGENARLQAEVHRLFVTRLMEFRESVSTMQESVSNIERRFDQIASAPTAPAHTSAVPVGHNLLLTKVLNRFPMYVEASDMSVTPHLVLDGSWEKIITEAFAARLKPGMTVVDVGANYGYYTLLAASHVGWDGRSNTAGRVYAFEPNPRTFEVLTKNVHVNGFQSIVRLHSTAALDEQKKMPLHRMEKFVGTSSLFEPVGQPEPDCDPALRPLVDTVRLDDVIQEPVDLMKMDAEGSEPLIFQGMRGILGRSPNLTIFLEFYVPMIRQTMAPSRFLDEIRDLGFSIQWFTPWGALEPFDQKLALQYPRFDLLLERPQPVSTVAPKKVAAVEVAVAQPKLAAEKQPAQHSESTAEAFLPGRFEVLQRAPVWMTMSERVVLYGLIAGLRPHRCLEVGTFRGGSAMIITAALDDLGQGRLACVDPNAQVLPEHWQSIAHRATLFHGPSPDVLPQASQSVGGKFDFALIDGDHSTEGVIRDIEGTLPHLEDHAYLLFHDAHNAEVIEGIDHCVGYSGKELTDCGMVSTEKTPDPAPGVFWGGLRMLRFDRKAGA